MTVDRDGTILFINRTLPDLFPAEQTIGTSLYDHIPPEHHDTVRESIEHVFRAGEPDSYESEGPGPDGTTAYYEVRVGPIKHEGQVVAAILIGNDITKTMDRVIRKRYCGWSTSM